MEKTFLIIFFFTFQIFAQNGVNPPAKSKIIESSEQLNFVSKIEGTIKEISMLKAGEFPARIGSLRKKVEKFLEYQKRICQGEFSTIVLNEFNDKDSDNNDVKKLNKEERKLCFRELKNIQIIFINNMYTARLNYLKGTHQEEITSLQLAKEQAIKSIKKTFSKF